MLIYQWRKGGGGREESGRVVIQYTVFELLLLDRETGPERLVLLKELYARGSFFFEFRRTLVWSSFLAI